MSRTLEEILARARETGCDWMLTAEEAGLLRREVERLRARLKTQHPDFYADSVDELEKIGVGLCGAVDLHVNRANVAEAQLTSERERGAKADALMLEKMHGLESDISCLQFDQRTLLTQKANLETQLAEERAKREEADRVIVTLDGALSNACNRAGGEAARADKAEREIERLTGVVNRLAIEESAAIAAGKKAERELAEERTKKCDYRAEYEAEYGKRTVAEARVAQLEQRVSNFEMAYHSQIDQRVAAERRSYELQARVDAATTFRFGDIYAGKAGDRTTWQVFAHGENWVRTAMSRDEAIALARDLAAKKKEPT